MATAGEGRAPYESSGAGGKLRKRPFRRSAPATPYDRPATALRNNKPGLLTKLVDPASRLIYAGANKLFGVFRKRLPPLSLQGPPEINEEPQNVSQESGQNNSIGVSKRINQDGNSASISAATGISDLEQMLKQKTFTRSEIQHLTTLLHSRTTDSPSDNITETNGANPSPLLRTEASTSGSMKKHAAISTPFVSSKVFEESTPSPADVAKSYMGTITRPTTKLMNNTTPFQNTSITPKTANNFKNQENGFLITPRSHGRSAMYSMARTPYSRSPNQNTSHGTSLKRRSSVLEDDFGSVGPLRRTRQKPNLMLQSKKELGYTISQQPMLLKNKPEENSDTIMSKSTHFSVPEKSTQTAMKIFQQLESLTPKSPTKLTSNMLHGQALRSLEKVDSVKYLQTSQCNGESASTSRGKEKVEENGSRKFPVPFNMLATSTNGNGDVAVIKESAQVVAIDDDDESALNLPPEPPQKKRAFQMSVTEIDDDDDDVEDDDDIIHVNGHVSFPPVENNKKLETSPVVNKPVTADIIEVTTPPEVFKTPAPVEATPVVVEAAKVLEPEKAKPPPKTDGFFGEKETGFKFSSTFTAQKDEVTPAQKVSPFQFSEYKPKESSEPKPKPIESTSVFSSETKNDQFKVTNTDDKKVEAIPAATSASGMFSFASSAKNSSGPSVTPDSTPSVFSSLASFPASGGNASSVFNNTSTTNITPATTSSLSSPPPVFSFGSGKAITSMPESSNTEGVIEKEPKSTISSSPFFAATTTAAATTSNGGGLFGFSSPAATSTPATTTTTTNGGGLFGFSSPAATSTTTTAATTNGGGALFGFSAPAATSTTTTTTTSAATNGGGLFGFSAPAATSTAAAAANGGAPFGFSSPAANSTTSTATNAGALFGFGAPAATSTTATATNGGSPFGFSAPATTSTTTTTASASATNGGALFGFSAPSSTSTTTNATNSSALFGFSAPATTSTTTTTTTTASPLFGFSSLSPTTTPTNSFFNTTTTTSQTNPSSTTQSAPFQFASGPTTSPTFGITPVSEGKSGNSTTTTVFGSSWQQQPPQNPPVFSFGASSSASTTPITFGAPKTTPSSSSSMFSFSSSSPVFPNNNNHITNGNDQMSMEDSMAEDSMQTPSPVPSPFGQPAAAPGFMFGAPVAAPPQAAAPAPFQFGGPAPQNPFQSSSVEFNGGGGSFSLGSGGEKAGRRIVRVNKSKNRRK